MERIDKDEVDGDMEKIGRNVISSINLLSIENQKTVDYIYRINELRKRKEKFAEIMKKKKEL